MVLCVSNITVQIVTKCLNQELHINARYGVISVEETNVKIFHPECAQIAIKCIDLMNVRWLIKQRRKMVRVTIKAKQCHLYVSKFGSVLSVV